MPNNKLHTILEAFLSRVRIFYYNKLIYEAVYLKVTFKLIVTWHKVQKSRVNTIHTIIWKL